MKITRFLGRSAIAFFLLTALAFPPHAFADDSGDSSDSSETSESGDEAGDEYSDFGDVYGDSPEKRYPECAMSNYDNAVEELHKAQENGADEETINELMERVEEAYEELKEACEENGYSVSRSDTTDAVLVTDSDGKAVTVVGDPVIFSRGLYTTSATDMTIAVGQSLFSVVRNYTSSPSDTPEVSSYGSFGRKWTTNLDCRIIRGRAELKRWSDYCKMDYDALMVFLQEKLDSVSKFAEAEANSSEYEQCLETYSDLEEFIEKQRRFRRYLERNLENKRLCSYTSYGEASVSCDSIGPDMLMYVDDSGNPNIFKSSVEGVFEPAFSSLRGNVRIEEGEDGFVLFCSDGEKRKFDKYGVISSIERKDGTTVLFTSKNGRVARVTLKSVLGGSRSISVKRDSTCITSISDGTRTVSYGYDGKLLSSVTDFDGGSKKFEYDDDRLVRIVKPDGAFVAIEYDTELLFPDDDSGDDCEDVSDDEGLSGEPVFKARYRVVSTTNELGFTERFVYDEGGSSVEYIDHDGESFLYSYDSNGNTVLQKYPDGSSYSFEYDDDGKKTRSVGDILTTEFFYDDMGNVSRVKYSDGSEEHFTYLDGELVSKTDRDGVVTVFEYDGFGNLQGMYVGGKKTAELVFENGLMKRSTDIFGNVSEYEYDNLSQMTKKSVFKSGESSPSSVKTWKYDSIGRVSEIVDEAGIVHSYAYSPHSVKTTVSDGTEIVCVYSPRKCVTEKTVSDLRTGESRTTHYEYDSALRLVSVSVSGIDSSGKSVPKTLVSSYGYTRSGRISKKVDWNAFAPSCDSVTHGWALEYSFKNGKIAASTTGFSSIDGNVLQDGKRMSSFDTSFFANRKIAIETRGDGSVFSSEFDRFGNIVRETANGISLMEVSYSPAGRISSCSSVGQGSIEFVYDSASGRLLGAREVGGAKNSFNKIEYYDNGWKKREVDRLGNATEYSYDCFGNISEVKTVKGTAVVVRDALGHVLFEEARSPSGEVLLRKDFSYSDGFRRVDVSVGGVRVGTSVRNSFGNTVLEIDGEGNERRSSYDILGRKTASINASGDTTLFEYNARGQVVRELYPDGSFKRFLYDAFGNCIQVEDSCGAIYRAEYDGSSRVVLADSRPFSSPTEYSYDDAGRLVSVVKNGIALESYEYSGDGKKTVRIDSLGRRNVYALDGFGRVVSEKNRLGFDSAFTYDGEGKILSSTDFEGRSKRIERAYNVNGGNHSVKVSCSDGTFSYAEYDALERIVLAKNSGSEIRYEYDSFGKLSSFRDVVSGVAAEYSRDKNGRVVRMRSSGGVGRDLSYFYGKNGEIIKIIDSVATDSVPLVTEIDFEYDMLGRETLRRFSSRETVSSSYDKAGRLSMRVGRDPSGAVLFVDGSLYDSDGHLTHSVDANMDIRCYEYDEFGRLSSVSYPYSESLKSHFDVFFEDSTGASPSSVDVSRLAVRAGAFAELQSLMSSSGGGRVSVDRNVLKESFLYDSEGNIVERSTPVGRVFYGYDGENRLVAAGASPSLRGLSVTYDRNGNMTKKITNSATSVFEYNAENRMKRSIVTCSGGDVRDTSYGYDFFGRRNMAGTKTTVFDAFSLRELFTKDSALADDGSCYASADGFRGADGGSASSGRYIFIDDGDDSMDIGAPSSSSGTRAGVAASVAPVYASGLSPVSFASVGSSSGSASFCSILLCDSVGTVKAFVGENGDVSSVGYDAFGSCYGSSSPVFSFIGKRLDESSGTYDFGHRDYMPRFSRFTTVDPVKDGRNWYSYCDANPVDFFDADGYEMATNNSRSGYANDSGFTEYWMQDSEWGSDKLGDGKAEYTYTDSAGNVHIETLSNTGCAVTAFAEAVSNVYGIDITPDMLNGKDEFFNEDNFDKGAAASALGLSLETSSRGVDNVVAFVNEKIGDEDKDYALVMEARIGSEQNSPHFVSVSGNAEKTDDGKASVPITATSMNDSTSAYGRGAAGFTNQDGELRAGVSSQSYAYSLSADCAN